MSPPPEVTPPRSVASANGELDLPALGASLWRKKWQILRPTILVAVLALVAVQLVTPRYQSESRVLIEGRDNIYLRPDADRNAADRTVDEQMVTSQAQVILSRDLALEVIKKLKLNERPEFDPALKGVSPITAILGLLGIVKDPLSMTPEERVLSAYYDRLAVIPVDKSSVINIDFTSNDPELAARVANAVAEAYLERQGQAKQQQAESAGDWLAGQIETMRKKVEDAEGKVEDYRGKSNLLTGANNVTLSAQQLTEVNAQLGVARSQKADAEAKAKMIRDLMHSGQSLEASDILNSDMIRRLSEQRTTLRAQLAEQSATLLDNHPRIKELRAQIGELDSQIRTAADQLARAFENDAKLAGARVDSQSAMLDQVKKQATSTNGQDVQLRALERDAKSQRDLLESYLAKYREASSHDTVNSTPADARIVSRATVSNIATYPKKMPTVLIAAFATLVLSAGFLMTREILAAPSFVPVRTGVPVGYEDASPRVADLFGGPRVGGVATATSNSSVAGLTAAIKRSGDGAVAIFSTAPGLNAGQTAIKLARSLAEDSRVVLVGLASARHLIRGISNEPSADGLSELAGGTASIGSVITKDRLSPLHLIAPGRTPMDRIELLALPGMVLSFSALARSYDHVVIDAGDVAGPEIERIAEVAPHAVLVADAVGNPVTTAARERLVANGFSDVRIFVGAYAAPEGAAAA
ncbi:MAG TPA: exopolysaccharide transport family protein [Xanthobacteraceae bacterium]|nr:exopolysaccharide transport family protein [Xanthobacteraceae bacterium]